MGDDGSPGWSGTTRQLPQRDALSLRRSSGVGQPGAGLLLDGRALGPDYDDAAAIDEQQQPHAREPSRRRLRVRPEQIEGGLVEVVALSDGSDQLR